MTEETADQRMRRMAKEYGIPYNPPATAQPVAAPVQAKPVAQPAPRGGIGEGIRGIFDRRKEQIDKATGYAFGGLVGSSPLASMPEEDQNKQKAQQQTAIQAGMPDPFGGDFDAINAEKTARWKMQDMASAAKYAPNHNERKSIIGWLESAFGDYSKKYGVNEMQFSNGGKPNPRGAKIKGPGTPTSDSIPGVVAETGDPIAVSTDERIVSAEQEKALMRIAEMLGFQSVDALFESMTGKPVGPTIKGGKLAAATGMSPEDDPVKRGIATMKSQLAPQQPAPTAKQVYSGLGIGGLSSNYVGNGPTDPDVNGRNAVTQPSGAVQRGITAMQGQINQTPAPMFADNAKASAAGEAHLKSLYPAGTFDSPAQAQRPSMADGGRGIIAGLDINNPGQKQRNMAAADVALKTAQGGIAGGVPGAVRTTTMPAGSKAPMGSGYDAADNPLGGRDISGQKLITNVADGAGVDDSSASALRDQQSNNPYWSPAAQLERMQRRRLETDAFDPSITDPRVRDTAQKALGILGNPADQQLKQAQAQGIFGQNESNAQLAALQKKALSGDQQALATLAALRGKGDANLRDNFMAVGGGQEFDATAGVMRNVPQRLIDLRTGKEVGGSAQQQAQGPSFSSKAELQAAIKAGKVKPGQTVMTPNGPMVVK